jgi:hypothetical protein
MSEPVAPNSRAEPNATGGDETIRERMRELTTEALQHGRLDTARVRDVVRVVAGLDESGPAPAAAAEVRQTIADAVKGLDAALLRSAGAAHVALERLASRGKDFTDNDLKDALVSLAQLHEDCVAATSRLADATSGDLRRKLTELAVHAQAVGVDASARVATIMSELAGRLGSVSQESATAGLETARAYSVRMAMLASGFLAGVADAIRDQSQTKKDT